MKKGCRRKINCLTVLTLFILSLYTGIEFGTDRTADKNTPTENIQDRSPSVSESTPEKYCNISENFGVTTGCPISLNPYDFSGNNGTRPYSIERTEININRINESGDFAENGRFDNGTEKWSLTDTEDVSFWTIDNGTTGPNNIAVVNITGKEQSHPYSRYNKSGELTDYLPSAGDWSFGNNDTTSTYYSEFDFLRNLVGDGTGSIRLEWAPPAGSIGSREGYASTVFYYNGTANIADAELSFYYLMEISGTFGVPSVASVSFTVSITAPNGTEIIPEGGTFKINGSSPTSSGSPYTFVMFDKNALAGIFSETGNYTLKFKSIHTHQPYSSGESIDTLVRIDGIRLVINYTRKDIPPGHKIGIGSDIEFNRTPLYDGLLSFNYMLTPPPPDLNSSEYTFYISLNNFTENITTLSNTSFNTWHTFSTAVNTSYLSGAYLHLEIGIENHGNSTGSIYPDENWVFYVDNISLIMNTSVRPSVIDLRAKIFGVIENRTDYVYYIGVNDTFSGGTSVGTAVFTAEKNPIVPYIFRPTRYNGTFLTATGNFIEFISDSNRDISISVEIRIIGRSWKDIIKSALTNFTEGLASRFYNLAEHFYGSGDKLADLFRKIYPIVNACAHGRIDEAMKESAAVTPDLPVMLGYLLNSPVFTDRYDIFGNGSIPIGTNTFSAGLYDNISGPFADISDELARFAGYDFNPDIIGNGLYTLYKSYGDMILNIPTELYSRINGMDDDIGIFKNGSEIALLAGYLEEATESVLLTGREISGYLTVDTIGITERLADYPAFNPPIGKDILLSPEFVGFYTGFTGLLLDIIDYNMNRSDNNPKNGGIILSGLRSPAYGGQSVPNTPIYPEEIIPDSIGFMGDVFPAFSFLPNGAGETENAISDNKRIYITVSESSFLLYSAIMMLINGKLLRENAVKAAKTVSTTVETLLNIFTSDGVTAEKIMDYYHRPFPFGFTVDTETNNRLNLEITGRMESGEENIPVNITLLTDYLILTENGTLIPGTGVSALKNIEMTSAENKGTVNLTAVYNLPPPAVYTGIFGKVTPNGIIPAYLTGINVYIDGIYCGRKAVIINGTAPTEEAGTDLHFIKYNGREFGTDPYSSSVIKREELFANDTFETDLSELLADNLPDNPDYRIALVIKAGEGGCINKITFKTPYTEKPLNLSIESPAEAEIYPLGKTVSQGISIGPIGGGYSVIFTAQALVKFLYGNSAEYNPSLLAEIGIGGETTIGCPVTVISASAEPPAPGFIIPNNTVYIRYPTDLSNKLLLAVPAVFPSRAAFSTVSVTADYDTEYFDPEAYIYDYKYIPLADKYMNYYILLFYRHKSASVSAPKLVLKVKSPDGGQISVNISITLIIPTYYRFLPPLTPVPASVFISGMIVGISAVFCSRFYKKLYNLRNFGKIGRLKRNPETLNTEKGDGR